MNRRTVVFWAGLVALLLIVGLLSGGRQESGPPLHPDSTDPAGTRALMIFLDERGAEIVDDLPDERIATALLLADQLDDDSRTELEEWVEAGGTLLVVDTSSSFAPPAASFEGRDTLPAGECTLAGLVGLELQADSFLRFANAETANDDPGLAATDFCFGDGDLSHVHVRPSGAGRIVSVGGGSIFTNENLDEADNAVVAARLLLGGAGVGDGLDPGPPTDPTIAVLFDPILAPGSRGLADLVPSEAKWAVGQLLVAFAVYVLWRLPRFGRPVPEPQPVELPASLLVRATGELHRRAGGHAQASSTLRADLDRRLRRQLRASPELPMPDLIETAAATAAVDAATVGRALVGPPAGNGDELAALLSDIDAVNRALLADYDPTIGDHP